jgi:hypothetical protein
MMIKRTFGKERNKAKGARSPDPGSNFSGGSFLLSSLSWVDVGFAFHWAPLLFHPHRAKLTPKKGFTFICPMLR